MKKNKFYIVNQKKIDKNGLNFYVLQRIQYQLIHIIILDMFYDNHILHQLNKAQKLKQIKNMQLKLLMKRILMKHKD